MRLDIIWLLVYPLARKGTSGDGPFSFESFSRASSGLLLYYAIYYYICIVK